MLEADQNVVVAVEAVKVGEEPITPRAAAQVVAGAIVEDRRAALEQLQGALVELLTAIRER